MTTTTRTITVGDLQAIMDGRLEGSTVEFRAWQEGLVTYDRQPGQPGRGRRRPPLLTHEGAAMLGIATDRA